MFRKMNVLFAVGLIGALGCGNCGGTPTPVSDVTEQPQAQVGPRVEIQIALPDEGPRMVESQLVTKIERALDAEEDIRQIRSTSRAGQAQVWVQFNTGIADSYAIDISTRALERIRRMPETAGEPNIQVVDINDPLALRLKSSDMDALMDASDALEATLSAMDGVTAVTSSLQPVSSVEITYDEDKIRELGMRSFGVAHQVDSSGLVEEGNLDALRGLSIETRSGEPMTLGDLAHVDMGRTPTQLDRFNGKRVAWLVVQAADEAATRTAMEALTSPNSAVTISVP